VRIFREPALDLGEEEKIPARTDAEAACPGVRYCRKPIHRTPTHQAPGAPNMSAVTSPSPTQPAAAPPRPRWGLGLVVGLLVLVAAVTALTGLAWLLRTTETTSQSFAEPITTVVIDNDAGAIEVRAGEVTEVATTRTWAWWNEPRVEAALDGDVLRLRSSCRGFLQVGVCSTRHAVQVPAGTQVVARTSAGPVTVTGTTAGADVRSSAGSVRVEDVAGPVRARSSAGSVTVDGASDDIEARSSAGGVTVTTSVVPVRIVANSSAGSVEVVVPDDVYRVDASSTAGSVTTDVRTDPDARRSISASSSAGSVTVRRR
jgi:hypothetical protein